VYVVAVGWSSPELPLLVTVTVAVNQLHRSLSTCRVAEQPAPPVGWRNCIGPPQPHQPTPARTGTTGTTGGAGGEGGEDGSYSPTTSTSLSSNAVRLSGFSFMTERGAVLALEELLTRLDAELQQGGRRARRRAR
jgi:hypothetical protein